MRALGGVRALARMDTGALTARLTAAGKERGVGVLWTAGARDLLSRPGPSAGLTFEVLGGCVCVLAEEEVESSAKEVLWMDLRETLDGGEFDPATLAAYPELAALAPTPGAPTRSPSLAQAYLSQHVARDTWDQDPRLLDPHDSGAPAGRGPDALGPGRDRGPHDRLEGRVRAGARRGGAAAGQR